MDDTLWYMDYVAMWKIVIGSYNSICIMCLVKVLY